MVYRVGINGFGRIGLQAFKMINQGAFGDLFEVVAVNDLAPPETLSTLLRYDSTYGRFNADIEAADKSLRVNGKEIAIFAEKQPRRIPWKAQEVDVVIESTGLFTNADDAQGHVKAGASKIVISAPAKGEDVTIVLGVNENMYDAEKHHILSNASCTTNCLAPVAKVIHEKFGVRSAQMTTIHSYTNDQQLLDLPHKDLRRARAAALSMIPTSTGAAKAVALVLPELKGKFDGISVRVPTPNVSLVDVVIDLETETTAEDVNRAFKDAANEELRGILAFSEEPLVSVDFKRNSNSSIVDAEYTKVIGGRMLKVLSWYDNEWGYSCRVRDLIKYIASKGL